MTMVLPSISPGKSVDRVILRSWVRAYSDGKSSHSRSPDPGGASEGTRSGSDSRAAWLKWHRGSCVDWFSEEQMLWYMALERARVECRAGRELPGVARNLRALPLEGLELAPAVKELYLSARSLWGLGFDSLPANDLGRSGGFLKRLRRMTRRDQRLVLKSAEVRSLLVAAGQCLDDETDFARSVHPLVARLSGTLGNKTLDPEAFESDELELRESEEETEVGYGADQQPELYSRIGNYAVFRTAWDECEPARVWHHPADDDALRELNALDRRKVQKLAHQLQRRLLVQRLRHWDFELEEGTLDSRKLATLVGERPNHRVFKFEREARVPEACVTLLVDQSGSMRGSAHLMAAQAIDIAVHTLEVCGVSAEVLAYTTVYGADNPVVETWRKLGAPEHPGRLNALRHIILKPAGQPWRVARRHLGLLLRPDFGYENVDGESLYWAARRLLARPEQRKILIVISDGSPYDEATVENNDSHFLAHHLLDVIRVVERSPVRLLGIGTGREVGRFYSHAATVRRGDMIGDVLFGALGSLLDPSERTL